MRIDRRKLKKYAKLAGQLLVEFLVVTVIDKLKGGKFWK
jgi:hypothetical protein